MAEKADEKADSFAFRYENQRQWIDRVSKRGAVTPNDKPRVGTLSWVVPEVDFATGNLDRSFKTFSAEVPIGAKIGKSYLYEILPFNKPRPEWFGLNDDDEGREKAKVRAKYVRELYGRYYAKMVKDKIAERAFQVALWELFHETKPAPYDLKNGAFISPDLGPDLAKAPAYVQKAQDYLKSLTGDDEIFDDNRKDWNYRVLVYLNGLASPQAGGEVGPAQLTFQHSQASSSELGANAYGAGSGLGVGNPGGGNSGSGGNGGAGDPNFGGDGSSLGSLSGSSLSQTPNVTPGPGGAGAPPGGGVRPPGPNLPIQPSINPVPAPSGLYLGLVAIAAWLIRRGAIRVNWKKFPR